MVVGSFWSSKGDKWGTFICVWMELWIPWISNIIKDQISGQKLDVEGMGSFYIDWHLVGGTWRQSSACLVVLKVQIHPFHVLGAWEKWSVKAKRVTMMTHLEMNHGLVVFFNHLHWLLPIETLLTLAGALYCHFLLPMFTFVLYMPSCVYSIGSSNATSIMHLPCMEKLVKMRLFPR